MTIIGVWVPVSKYDYSSLCVTTDWNTTLTDVGCVTWTDGGGGQMVNLWLTQHRWLCFATDNEFDAIFTPGFAKRQLFASKSTLPVASPSICCYLTTVGNSAQPSFCGPLNFLDTQIIFDAVFLPLLDCKPIFALSVTSTQPSPVSCPDNTTKPAIQVCRLLVFKAMLLLDYIGHHNFSSAD